jgi:hypothetical protein
VRIVSFMLARGTVEPTQTVEGLLSHACDFVDLLFLATVELPSVYSGFGRDCDFRFAMSAFLARNKDERYEKD